MNKKYIESLQYNEFKDLIFYLKEISIEKDEKEQVKYVLKNIERFFPSLSTLEQLEFNKILLDTLDEKDDAEKLFIDFKEKYPKIEIDPHGKSTPTKKNYWEITLASLENIYYTAFEDLRRNSFIDNNKYKLNTQVYNAKNLTPFINKGKITSNYIFNRQIFLKKNSSQLINSTNLRNMENILKKVVGNVDLLNSLLDYIKNEKYENYSLLVDHLFTRIELLGQDPNLTNQITKDFYEKIKEII